MKLNRRSFFGAAVAAPVVGKRAVTEAIEAHGASLSNTIGGSMLGYAPSVPNNDYVEQLERAAKGIFTDDEITEWRMYDMHTRLARAANIDALRSVSPAVKFTLMSDRELAITKKQRKWSSLRELLRMGRRL